MGKYTFFIIGLIIIFAILQECECRRKILKGRNTINRKYMRASAVPGWVTVVLIALGQITFGGLLYLLLKVLILNKPLKPRYMQPPETFEASP